MTETAASALAVLRARLPYVDRRSLSEAWFSALHVAAAAPAAAGSAGGVTVAFERASMQAAGLPAAIPSLPEPAVTAAASGRALPASRPAASPSGEPARPLERRAEPKPLVEAQPPAPRRFVRAGSLTLGAGRSRVQLVLRREGAVLHVVALCRRDSVELVGRALASAGLHVRSYGAGESVRATVCALDGGALRP